MSIDFLKTYFTFPSLLTIQEPLDKWLTSGSGATTVFLVLMGGKKYLSIRTPFTTELLQTNPTNDWWSHKVKTAILLNLFTIRLRAKTVNGGLMVFLHSLGRDC